jgi:acetolactate synthase regulatory subunit
MNMTMSTTRLQIRMTFVEGALIRLLGLAGRRGFDIASVHAHRSEGGWYDVVLELLGSRSVVTLQKQIEKLYDVQHVHIVPEAHIAHLRIAAAQSADELHRTHLAV